eukprot:m.121517 g.121517  ORF g.121517 m.121517 type:complete len:820 (+) comp9299_c0_seq8:1274-3733(+)
MPVGIDIVLLGVSEPVRFVRDIKVHVYGPRERFWSYGKRECVPRTFEVQLSTKTAAGQAEFHVAAVSCLEPTVKDTYMSRLNKMIGKFAEEVRAHADTEVPDIPVAANSEHGGSDNEDDEIVIVSGSGTVERDVGGTVLDQWAEVLRTWDTQPHRAIHGLVRAGIPETLRHQVWLRLAEGVSSDLVEMYPYLLAKDPATTEERSDLKVIKWDLTRTFPAHEFFKDPDGEGQRRLYNLCRAYAVYDEEIGYCQGLSFISAVLLLHMPEEEAFTMFVKIMYDYGVRDMFKQGFENLQLKLYQLGRLMEEHVPDVATYFASLGVVPHMYASQWFLTLFVAKFSLPMVYHIMDMFLCEGLPVLFQVALAFIKLSRKELLGCSFEEIQHFFRVVLPRTYATDAQAEGVIKNACSIKINSKKLQQYEQEYYLQKVQEADDAEDPQKKITHLQTAVLDLKVQNDRLEAEAENIAQDLLNQRTEMQGTIDRLEQEKQAALAEVAELQARIARVRVEAEEDKARLAQEAVQVKDMYRRTVTDADAEQAKLRKELETLHKTHEAEMVSIRRNEDRMQHLINSLQAKADLSSAGEDAVALQTRVYDTELALAAVKLQLAETESQCQLLAQQLQAATAREDSKKQGAGAAASIATWFRRKAPSAGTDKDREKEVGSQRDLKPTTPTPPQHASPQSDRVSAIASPPAIFEPVSSPLASGDAVVSPPTIADAWYAGSLSKTDAEARMQCQPVGAFVVSEAGAGLLLSVSTAPGKAAQLAISKTETGAFVLAGSKATFDTLAALIDFYRSIPITDGVCLASEASPRPSPLAVRK